MGEVLLVHDTYMDRPVAMKLIKERPSLTEEHVLRFIDEVKCQSKLQHPGIISVYDIGQVDDHRIFFYYESRRGD
jgi:serine/threonine-protein kinase